MSQKAPIELMDSEAPIIPADLDRSILDSIIMRLWKTHPRMEAEMALEIISGPYKGIVFAWGPFEASTKKTEDGLTPVKFTTKILKATPDFVKDAAWDAWTSEVMLAWMAHTAVHNYQQLLTMPGARSTRRSIPGIH